MQQKRSLIFQGFSRKVDNFYRFSVQLNAEFRLYEIGFLSYELSEMSTGV